MVAQPLTSAQWLTSWRQHHARIMTVVTLGLAILCLVHNDLPLTAQAIALVVAVAVLGVPHGGLDHVVAHKVLELIQAPYHMGKVVHQLLQLTQI